MTTNTKTTGQIMSISDYKKGDGKKLLAERKSEKVRKTSERVQVLRTRAQKKKAELEALVSALTQKEQYLKKHGVKVDETTFWENGLNGSSAKTTSDQLTETSSDEDAPKFAGHVRVHKFTDPQRYIRHVNAEYTEVGDEFDLFDSHYDESEAILLEGPKGCGKSLAIAKWCDLRGLPFITFDCSEGTKEGHLVGRLIVQGDETPFHMGAIPTIIEVANRHGGAVIIFEELNALTNQMQKLLNGLLDWRQAIYIEHLGTHVQLEENAQLLVMATMNPSSYSGVNDLNDDLLSRFTRILWDYAPMSTEKKLLKTKGVPNEVVKQLLKLAQETRASEKKGDVNHSISTRELDSCMNLFRAYGKRYDNPLSKLINGKIRGMYPDEDEWKTVKSRIESIFGREVFNEALKQQTDEEIEQTAQTEEDDQ